MVILSLLNLSFIKLARFKFLILLPTLFADSKRIIPTWLLGFSIILPNLPRLGISSPIVGKTGTRANL